MRRDGRAAHELRLPRPGAITCGRHARHTARGLCERSRAANMLHLLGPPWPPTQCVATPGPSFTHLSASMAVVGVRPELKQATEARSAARTCARWLAGRLPAASSIGLELDSTKSTCSPSVSSSRRLLPMVIRPGIGWVKLRRGVDTASRRDTGHAAAPPAGPAVHPVGLSQLRRWPIRPSGAP